MNILTAGTPEKFILDADKYNSENMLPKEKRAMARIWLHIVLLFQYVCSYVCKHMLQNQNLQQYGRCYQHVYIMYGITHRNCLLNERKDCEVRHSKRTKCQN